MQTTLAINSVKGFEILGAVARPSLACASDGYIFCTWQSFFRSNGHQSPTSPNVAVSSESGQIYVYDGEAGQLVKTISSHAMAVRNVSWSADSSLLVSASDDRHL